MKFTSQIIAAGSGSVGGCTYSRNRFGPYIRNRSVPVNPHTTFQNTMRGILATLVAQWTSLTSAQRAGWTSWAVGTPQVDALGNPITLTGQNAFIMMNSLRMQTSTTVVTTAPAALSNAVLTPPVPTTYVASTNILTSTFTNTDVWAGAVGGKLLVYTSRGQNASREYFNGPYRLAHTVNGAATPPTSPATGTGGFNVIAGQRVFVRYRCFNADARISTSWRTFINAT